MRSFCANILTPKNVQTENVSTKQLCAKLSYEKAVHKMLVKLTPGKQIMACLSFESDKYFSL
jgi:hypothetical protein